MLLDTAISNISFRKPICKTWCWASVADNGHIICHHWFNISCLLGKAQMHGCRIRANKRTDEQTNYWWKINRWMGGSPHYWIFTVEWRWNMCFFGIWMPEWGLYPRSPSFQAGNYNHVNHCSAPGPPPALQSHNYKTNHNEGTGNGNIVSVTVISWWRFISCESNVFYDKITGQS